MIHGRDFIVFSDDWGRHPFSCQHIMERFRPHNRLLWVHTIGLRSPRLTVYDFKRSVEKIRSWVTKGEQSPLVLPENLRIISPIMLPFNRIPAIRRFNRFSVVRAVRRAMDEWGMNKPILLATLPNATDYVGSFGEKLVVYYCVDDFTLWPGMNQPELVASMEQDLLKQSDLVVGVSDTLCKSRNNGRHKTQLLTHGVDFDHFSKAAEPQASIQGLSDLDRPIIGFYGLIDSHFDVSLMLQVVAARSEWQFVCIGTKRIEFGDLENRPNFHWYPAIPYAALPAAASWFDVAIVPYIVNAHTHSANPLKLREYIATGKPVVSTPMAEVFRFKGCVHIADGPEAFIQAIETALADPEPAEQRRAVLAGETWADKAELLSTWIEERLADASQKAGA